MSKPVIADIKPHKTELKPGETYYFCRCGRSADQPFCDGSHAGTDITPLGFEADKDEGYLCMCKHSANFPYCDGTHARFNKDQVGEEGPGPETIPRDGMPRPKASAEEPNVELIHDLAENGLEKVGHHGPMTAMGVPRDCLPKWDDIQIMVAQMATQPLLDDQPVGTELVIGPGADRPLTLKIPLMVSDMSFGALSEEAKVSLARGAELAGTGICSGEGGMLPEEQAANSRYFYELASAMFGYTEDHLKKVQAFHFKGGQGAKTGTGGHLPANKNVGKISQVRHIPEGEPAISPATFRELHSSDDFKRFADLPNLCCITCFVMLAPVSQYVALSPVIALDASADYIILDGRGGGTGAAPAIFRDHISVPTIPALARARRYLDEKGASGNVTLMITGGLRMPMDFVKALALGADGIALSNSAMQAIGCVGARMCNTNQCPAGIATQNEELRKRLDVDHAAQRLSNFFNAAVELMQVMARACGHDHLNQFTLDDLATFDRDMAALSGVSYGGVR